MRHTISNIRQALAPIIILVADELIVGETGPMPPALVPVARRSGRWRG